MVNGVDINDNLFGTANNLFIEDAIDETQVLTSASRPSTAASPAASSTSITQERRQRLLRQLPPEPDQPRVDRRDAARERRTASSIRADCSKTYEGTFGGPIVRDRLWFFTAGRYETANAAIRSRRPAAQFIRTDTNKRGELKLTGTVAPSHTLQGAYINNSTEQANTSGVPLTALVDASHAGHAPAAEPPVRAQLQRRAVGSRALASFQVLAQE